MEKQTLLMLLNGHGAAFNVLIEHLVEKGVVNRNELTKAFKKRADEMRGWADEYESGAHRHDLAILTALSVTTADNQYPDFVYRGSDWRPPGNDE